MKKSLNIVVVILFICAAFTCISCKKVFEDKKSIIKPIGPEDSITVTPLPGLGKSILVDASRDGAGWWFPQEFTFDASIWHQGTGLVEYFQSLGYTVDELPAGATVTKELLRKYRRVVRANCRGIYSDDEIEAYKEFLKGENSLLLFADHSANPAADQVSKLLGLNFEGIYYGSLTRFNQHAITANVTSFDFVAGAVIRRPNPHNIIVLAYYDNATVENAAAMGIVTHPSCKIVFIGDINGLELTPQPLTENLVKWLF